LAHLQQAAAPELAAGLSSRAALTPAMTHRTSDVVIVGGSMVGLCIAHQLLERGISHNITVLDKEPELGRQRQVHGGFGDRWFKRHRTQCLLT